MRRIRKRGERRKCLAQCKECSSAQRCNISPLGFSRFQVEGGGAFITCSGAVFLGELLSCSVGRWQDSRTTSPNSEFVWIERRVAHGGTLP